MLAPRALLVLVSSALLATGCGSIPTADLTLTSDPVGAKVYLSRRGKRAHRADFGPVEGDMSSEPLVEEFIYIGMSPLEYSTPLEENEKSARVLGFGGAVVLEYHEGMLRFEKEGFATVERHVRFRKGDIEMHVAMPDSEQEQASEPAREEAAGSSR